MVAVRIDQFQAAAATGRPRAPPSTIPIGHFVHHHVIEAGPDDTVVRAHDRVSHRKRQSCSLVRQRAAEIADGVAEIEIRIIGQQAG